MKGQLGIALFTLFGVVSLGAEREAAAQGRYGWAETHDYCGSYDAPLGGALDVYAGMHTHAINLPVAGDVRCRDVVGRRCRGRLYHHPIPLHVRRPTLVDIEVDHANVDTVLALVGPSGAFADDNGGRRRLSRIRALLQPGTTLFVRGRSAWPRVWLPGPVGDSRVALPTFGDGAIPSLSRSLPTAPPLAAPAMACPARPPSAPLGGS